MMVEVDSALVAANIEKEVEIEILSGDGWDVDGNESNMIIINNNIYFMLPVRTTNKNCDLF